MPHAVIMDATRFPDIDAPLLKEAAKIFRVVEVARAPKGWLLKCVIIQPGHDARHFLARVEVRDDGLVAHLDDHMPVERDDDVFHFLALVAGAIVRGNPGSRVGKTNLQKWLAPTMAT